MRRAENHRRAGPGTSNPVWDRGQARYSDMRRVGSCLPKVGGTTGALAPLVPMDEGRFASLKPFGSWRPEGFSELTMSIQDDPMAMTITQQMVMAHYNEYWGLATEVLRYAFSEKAQDAPFIAEFLLGSDDEPLYVYATIGMSESPQPGAPDGRRVELFVYSGRPLDELKQALAMLAIYPFQNGIALGPLDTIYGGRAIVDGSPL